MLKLNFKKRKKIKIREGGKKEREEIRTEELKKRDNATKRARRRREREKDCLCGWVWVCVWVGDGERK